VDRRSYLEAKFGGPGRTDAIYARVSAAAQEAGLTLALDAIRRQPNTLDAHRLIAWAQAQGVGDASDLVERLFRAYFVEGRHVGDRDELARLAADAGYDRAQARAFLESDALRDEIARSDERARTLGINGVPFFVFNGRVALSGAHEPATLLDAIAQARVAQPA
jgi:predicted DsbA family dithiol-disulfide isomerase